jgi:hypothetical protein
MNQQTTFCDFTVRMHSLRHTLAVAFEIMENFIPPTTVFKLDIQMFGVQPEHRHGGQEFSRESGFLSMLRTDGFRPTRTDAVAKTQFAVVVEYHDGLGKILVCLYRH